jgi:hypothetical protein
MVWEGRIIAVVERHQGAAERPTLLIAAAPTHSHLKRACTQTQLHAPIVTRNPVIPWV